LQHLGILDRSDLSGYTPRIMSVLNKRKQDLWSWEPDCPKAKWPKIDEPWTDEDMRSAMMINTLLLDVRGHRTMIHLKPIQIYARCSRLIQALDLAGFDDWDIEIDYDVWKPLPAIVQLWFALSGT
jgi:hypothetical protein